MKRRQYLDKEDMEILQWTMLPREQMEASPLTPKKQERYDRANVADNLIREHLSLRKVTEKLCDKFGYSDSTARRDIQLAQALWGSRNKLDKEYAGSMLWDIAVESIIKASKERKWGDVAKLIKEAREIAVFQDRHGDDGDMEDLKRPVALQPAFLPAAIGAQEMSTSDREALLRRIVVKKLSDGMVDRSIAAEFEDLHTDAESAE